MSTFRTYPEAVIAFRIRLGERYRDVQTWLDEAADGHRDGDVIWFTTVAGAEAFATEFEPRILELMERKPEDRREAIRTEHRPSFEATMRKIILAAEARREGQ